MAANTHNEPLLYLRNARNSKKQGDIGLVAAIYWFESNGYPVLLPLTDSQDYDLAADMDGKLCKVQVKTTYYRNRHGNYEVNLRVSGGNRSGTGKIKYFDSSLVDYLFAVTDSASKYLIPSVHIEATRSLTLGDKYAIYKVE